MRFGDAADFCSFGAVTSRAGTLEGDTALEKVIMGPGTGSQLLEQRVTRYAPGRSLPRGESDA